MRRPDYEARSEEAATALVDTGVPLQDSIVKIAQRDKMNPEQIKRLVEMANTASFLKMFGKTAGASDRMVDFDVADPTATVSAFYAKEGGAPESAGDETYFDDVGDEYAPPTEKVAAYEPIPAAGHIALRRNVRDGLSNNIRVAAVAEELRTKMAADSYAAEAISDALAREFKGIYGREKHAEFEEHSLALHGPAAIVPLSAIRQKISMAPLQRVPSAELIKQAAERVVVDGSDPTLLKVGSYIEKLTSWNRSRVALASLGETA